MEQIPWLDRKRIEIEKSKVLTVVQSLHHHLHVQTAQKEKTKNKVREEDIKNDLCLPLKQWELHSRQPFHHHFKLGRLELLW